MDVTQEDQVQEAVKQGIARFGRVDALVNNAGFGTIDLYRSNATKVAAEIEAWLPVATSTDHDHRVTAT